MPIRHVCAYVHHVYAGALVCWCTMCEPVHHVWPVHFVCVPVHHVCACVHHVCAWFLCRPEEAIGSPGTGLQTTVNHHLNAGTKPKSSPCFILRAISPALVNAYCSPY